MPPEEAEPATGKGRPTPRRKDAEALNRRPLVPTDRKVAKRAAREQRNAAYARQQQAMITGDERFLPPRDKGPARRWVRNYVDARFSPSEYFLPLALGSLVLLFLTSIWPEAAVYGMLLMYGAFIIALAFALVHTFVVKRRLAARFDADVIPRFTAMYAFSRLFQPRFLRAPKPQVARGEKDGEQQDAR